MCCSSSATHSAGQFSQFAKNQSASIHISRFVASLLKQRKTPRLTMANKLISFRNLPIFLARLDHALEIARADMMLQDLLKSAHRTDHYKTYTKSAQKYTQKCTKYIKKCTKIHTKSAQKYTKIAQKS